MHKQNKEQPRIVPMRGEEIEMMFGDRSVLELESRHTEIGKELDEIAASLLSEEDPEQLQELRDRLRALRDEMRTLDREIRKEQRKYGEQRGPVSL